MEESLKQFILEKTEDKIVHISEIESTRGCYSKPEKIGYSEFDGCMDGGVREGDLIVLTGISGEGKTTYAQNITVNMTAEMIPCVWFSYEVMLSNLKAKFEMIADNKNYHLIDIPIFTPKRNTSGNIDWIKNKIIEAQKEIQVKAIFIDHIDFISPTRVKSSDQKRMMLKEICTELKSLAIDLKIMIFLIAHVKKVQGREIEMQDIAESSGIYQLADYVFAISRCKRKENNGGDIIEIDTDDGYIKMLKNRLTGEKPYLKFKMENNVIKPYTNIQQ